MSTKEKVIALGFFDGVHLGHAALLRRTVEEATKRGVIPAVFTFDRVPKEVVTPRTARTCCAVCTAFRKSSWSPLTRR